MLFYRIIERKYLYLFDFAFFLVYCIIKQNFINCELILSVTIIKMALLIYFYMIIKDANLSDHKMFLNCLQVTKTYYVRKNYKRLCIKSKKKYYAYGRPYVIFFIAYSRNILYESFHTISNAIEC